MSSKYLRLSNMPVLRVSIIVAMAFVANAIVGVQTTRADLVQLRYRGVVVEETFRTGSTSAISLGTFVEGVFSYDTTTEGQSFGPTQARYFDAVTTHEISLSGETFSANTPGLTVVDNNTASNEDRFTVANSSFTGTGTLNNMSVIDATLALSDSTATVFDSTDLPSSVDIEAFDSRSLWVAFANSGGTAITSYRVEVTSIPEPSYFALMLIATPVVGWVVYRSRHAKRANG